MAMPVALAIAQRRMDFLEQIAVRSLEPQQVTVGARLAPGRQLLLRPFAEAQRHRQRRFVLDPPDHLRHPLRR